MRVTEYTVANLLFFGVVDVFNAIPLLTKKAILLFRG